MPQVDSRLQRWLGEKLLLAAASLRELAPLALTVRTTQNLDKCAEFFGVLWIETKLPPYPHLDQGWAKPGNC